MYHNSLIAGINVYFNFTKNFFEEKYIDDLTNKITQLSFEKAGVQLYGENKQINSIRNNSRVEFKDKVLAHDINQKLKQIKNFPLILNNSEYVCPSANFRAYCYEKGQYFKPHKDGAIQEEGLTSKITCLIYLNDANGGNTVLMPDGFALKETHIRIPATKGSILLFEHKMWHEGATLKEGFKYVIRTDLLYK